MEQGEQALLGFWGGGGDGKRAMGVAGGLKREGPKVSARKQGWEGRGDRGRTLLPGEIRGRWGMTGGPGGAVREGDTVVSERAERGPAGTIWVERTGVASWAGRLRGSVGPIWGVGAGLRVRAGRACGEGLGRGCWTGFGFPIGFLSSFSFSISSLFSISNSNKV